MLNYQENIIIVSKLNHEHFPIKRCNTSSVMNDYTTLSPHVFKTYTIIVVFSSPIGLLA